jgi:hypothetical protein
MAAPFVLPPGSCDRRLLRHFLARWWNPGRCYRVLDLSGGEAQLPREMVLFARAQEITLRIDAVGAAGNNPDFPEIVNVAGERLAFATDESYDLVHCALALSCYEEVEAVRLLRRCRELSTRWTLLSDLSRQPGAALVAWLLDGPASPLGQVRAAFRRALAFRELGALATQAGWQGFGHARFLGCRQAIWREGRDLAEIPLESFELPSPA